MRLEWSGGSREVGDRPVLVGRDPVACDVAIEHDSLLSRLHFAIVPGAGSAFLLDLRSSNGTYVNGSRVHYSRLRAGDQIRAGTGRFEVQDDSPRRAQWALLPEPTVAFLAGGGRDPFLQFLRNLRLVPSREVALQSAAECLMASAAATEGPQVAAFALEMDRGEPVAQAAVGAPPSYLAEVLGPLLHRVRHLERPFLVQSLRQETGFLPRGYPIRIEHVGAVAAAPLGAEADRGLLCLCAIDPGGELVAEHLILVESFALALDLAMDRLRRESAQGS